MSRPRAQPSLAAAVGRRLRALREGQRLSLSELARRASLGKGTLSELEAGQRNPTLETLYALTTALGVPLSAAIPTSDGLDEPDSAATLHGSAVAATLVARFDDRDTTTELYRIRIARGHTQRSAAHAPGVIEYLVVFAGVAVVGPATAPFAIRTGASGSWPADVEHSYSAAGEEDVDAALLIRYPAAPEA